MAVLFVLCPTESYGKTVSFINLTMFFRTFWALRSIKRQLDLVQHFPVDKV